MAGADAPLAPQVALRVALAARALKGPDTAYLLRVLIDLLGEPITEARLSRLRLARLRGRLLKVLEGDDQARERQLQQAMGLLKGRGVEMPKEAPPKFESALPVPAVRVACASCGAERLDGRFSDCSRFLIYQVSVLGVRLVEWRDAEHLQIGKERLARRADLIADCRMLYALSVGGPALAGLVRAGLHVVQMGAPRPAREALSELQGVLQGNPPPWLANALRAQPAQGRAAGPQSCDEPAAAQPQTPTVKPRVLIGEN